MISPGACSRLQGCQSLHCSALCRRCFLSCCGGMGSFRWMHFGGGQSNTAKVVYGRVFSCVKIGEDERPDCALLSFRSLCVARRYCVTASDFLVAGAQPFSRSVRSVVEMPVPFIGFQAFIHHPSSSISIPNSSFSNSVKVLPSLKYTHSPFCSSPSIPGPLLAAPSPPVESSEVSGVEGDVRT